MTFTMQYDETSHVQRGMAEDFAHDKYEPGTWRTFEWLVRKGDTVVDVGAHVGTFACLAAHLVGPTGSVVGFEPDNANRRQLIRNKAANHFDHLTVRPEAVAEVAGRQVFYRCSDNDGGHALWDPALSAANVLTKKNPHHRIVSTVTLDDVGPMQCRLLKIDTEGAEVHVITGAMDWLRRTRPAIIAEINAAGLQHMLSSEKELRALIREELEYDEYGINDVAPWYVPVAADKTLQPVGMQDGRRVMYDYPVGMQDGRRVMYVYNMLWLPHEWPEANELKRNPQLARLK